MKRILLAIFCMSLAGCASVNLADAPDGLAVCYLASGKEVPCYTRPKVGQSTHEKSFKRAFQSEPWMREGKQRPTIGIASGGGGTKASAFSMGVLKRLVDDETIKDVDLISSVSGGGHPVAFLYSRARLAQLSELDDCPASENKEGHDQNFQELKCLYTDLNQVQTQFPKKAIKKYASNNEAPITLALHSQILAVPTNDLIKESASQVTQYAPQTLIDAMKRQSYHQAKMRDKKSHGKINPMQPRGWDAAPNWDWNSKQEFAFRCIDSSTSNPIKREVDASYRSFTWHRCWQDVLSRWSSEVYEPGIKTYFNRAGAWIGGASLNTLTLPPHHVANTLFDWQVDMSPLYYIQRHGNERMGMDLPSNTKTDNWHATAKTDYGNSDAVKRKCLQFNFEDIKKNALNFADLRCATEMGLPTWIVTATTPTRPLYDLRRNDLEKMDDYRFEFTPYGFGSHKYGFVDNGLLDPAAKENTDIFKEHNLEFPKALSSSYAFLDSRQRVVTGFGNMADIPAYLIANGAIHALNSDWGISIPNYNMTPLTRHAYKALPAPINYYSRLDERKFRPHIPLADGGINRDGLGILPLLERRTENIIILNQGASISDLCQFNMFLKSKDLEFVFQGDPRKINLSSNIAPQQLQNGVGPNDFCTERYWDENESANLDYKKWSKPVWKGEIVSTSDKSKDFPKTNIYFITANIYTESDENGPRKCIRNILDSRNGNLGKAYELSKSVKDITLTHTAHDYQPSLCAWMDNNFDESDDNSFPAHSMAKLTMDSTQRITMAYVDLGWFLAGGLSEVFEANRGSKEK